MPAMITASFGLLIACAAPLPVVDVLPVHGEGPLVDTLGAEIRSAAADALHDHFSVAARAAISGCKDVACALPTLKKEGAAYALSASAVLGGDRRVVLELYDVATGALVGSETARAASDGALLDGTTNATRALLHKLSAPATVATSSAPSSSPSSSSSSSPSSSSSSASSPIPQSVATANDNASRTAAGGAGLALGAGLGLCGCALLSTSFIFIPSKWLDSNSSANTTVVFSAMDETTASILLFSFAGAGAAALVGGGAFAVLGGTTLAGGDGTPIAKTSSAAPNHAFTPLVAAPMPF
jgi:hypothetical protein